MLYRFVMSGVATDSGRDTKTAVAPSNQVRDGNQIFPDELMTFRPLKRAVGLSWETALTWLGWPLPSKKVPPMR